ncbi:hypothetical protein TMEN_5002 [Trichophyton mentagrophytes]|nr:hypothetical protein TMEN_5002 [Trichophyton mentagrophytes]
MGALVAVGLASVLAGLRTGVPRVPTDAADIVSQSYAGHVHAASGYRTTASGSNEKRQMDWALLRVPKARHLTNMVITYGGISPYADTIPLQPFPGIPREGTELIKLGRSTRKTWGLFSGLKECAYSHA